MRRVDMNDEESSKNEMVDFEIVNSLHVIGQVDTIYLE
jgi:hypothetical protein